MKKIMKAFVFRFLDALLIIIGIVTRDEKHSFELYTKAAHLMYPPSQVRLAYAYEHGVLGCDVDPKKSITWYNYSFF